MTSVSADENLEHKIDKKYPPLIEKTVFYIQDNFFRLLYLLFLEDKPYKYFETN